MFYISTFLFIFSTCCFASSSDFYVKNEDQTEKFKNFRASPQHLSHENEYSEYSRSVRITSKSGKKINSSSYEYSLNLLCMKDYPFLFPSHEEVLKYLFTNFSMVKNPSKGDLVVYYEKSDNDPEKNESFSHFGIYMGNGKIESVFDNEKLYLHSPFSVSSLYGDTLIYFSPKYKTLKQEKAINRRVEDLVNDGFLKNN